MTPVNELRHAIGAKLDIMQTYVDRATDEHRDLSRRESAAYDALKSDIDGLYDRLDRASVLERTRVGDPPARAAAAQRFYSRQEMDTAEADTPIPNVETLGRAQGTVLDGPATKKGNTMHLTQDAPGRLNLTDQYRGSFESGLHPEDLSFTKFVTALATGNWQHAPRERQAAMGGSSGTLGGYLVPLPLATKILDYARAKAVVQGLGAQLIPMETSELAIARQTSDPSATWHSENVADLTASDIGVGRLTLRLHTVAAMIKSSIELVEDSPLASDMILESLGAVIALEMDRCALRGQSNGSLKEPLGLLNDPSVVKTALGTPISTAALLDSCARLWTANHEPTGLIWGTATRRAFAGLLDGENRPLAEDGLPPEIRGLTRVSTTTCPTSEIYVGDWSRLAYGVHTRGLTVEVTRVGTESSQSAWNSLQVLVRCYLRLDAAATHPSAFDILTSVG